MQLLANHVARDGVHVEADGDVVVYYGDTILQADHVLYDTNRSVITLDGNVTVMEGLDYAMLGDHAVIEVNKKSDRVFDYFLGGFDTRLWVRGREAKREGSTLELANAFLSSCDVACPDWHIEFSSAEYNATTKWVDIWNPRFYVGDTPLFYLPYIGTSLEKERKSGLLRPGFGISDRDGFTYRQPVYLAIDPQWDLEVDPQWRSERGMGAYATFRFVDGPDSGGYLKGGYFRSKNSYVEDYNLRNSSHYGMELHYENGSLLTKPGDLYDDGLYVDVVYLNDPDYVNLQAGSVTDMAGSSQVQSRINYFYNMPDYYVGLYGKYYIDTALSSEDRKNTFQNVPTLQLHSYQAPLFGLDFLHYAADYRYNHFFTESGRHIQFQEMDLPVTFYWSFFDDYLKFSLSENLYYSYSSFSNMDAVLEAEKVESDYYSLFRNYHTMDLYTELARNFGETFHTLQLRVTYNKPSFSSEKGDTIDYIQVLRSPRENLLMSATNYLYDAKGREFLYYRIAQPVNYEPIEEIDDTYNRFGDLEQEIRYRFLEHYEFYTDLFFSYYLHNVSAATSSFKVAYPRYDISLDHFYKQRLDRDYTSSTYGKLVKTSDFFTLRGRYRSEAGHEYYGSIAYDNLHDRMSRWHAGVHLFYHCWDLDMGVRDEIVPILTSAEEADNIHNVIVYFTISLVPFGSYSQRFNQGL